MRKFLEFCFGHVIHIFTSLLLLYLCLPQRSFLPLLPELFKYEMEAGRTFPLLRKIRCRRKTAASSPETWENIWRHLVCRERISLVCTYAAPYHGKVLRTKLHFCLKSFSVIDQRAFGVEIVIPVRRPLEDGESFDYNRMLLNNCLYRLYIWWFWAVLCAILMIFSFHLCRVYNIAEWKTFCL